MNVYVTIALEEDEKERLREGAPDAQFFLAAEAPERERRAAFLESEAALGSPPPAWVAESERLRWLQLNSAGYAPYARLSPEERGADLVVTNAGGMFGAPVAETAMAGILYFYRGLDRLAPLQQERRWEGSALRRGLRKLEGARAVVLGPGAIGLALRDRLQAFGCAVTVLGRSSPEADIYTTDALDDALPEADVVAACLPENDATRGLFGAERLARLKPSALFVSVGRGSVVDEEALIRALREGRLGGAVLDVTQEEPLPPDHPLWACPNTLLTQHTGGGSRAEQMEKVEIFLDNHHRRQKGEPLRNVVLPG